MLSAGKIVPDVFRDHHIVLGGWAIAGTAD